MTASEPPAGGSDTIPGPTEEGVSSTFDFEKRRMCRPGSEGPRVDVSRQF